MAAVTTWSDFGKFQKNIFFLIDYAEAVNCGSQQTVENS